jgi:regulator of RNase E activity RraA
MAAPATTRLHALKAALVSGLQGVPALNGVQVTSAYIGDEQSAVESIQLIGDDRIEGDWATIGKFSRDETITLVGMIEVEKPGAGELVIQATRDRAVALMGEVEKFIVADPSVGGVVKQCKVRPTQMFEHYSAEGRWCLIRFEIEAYTRLQAS